ncbi:hypothetical protein [Aneurinibacillus aneurinilyticus]|uniref:hypothetical protein n=1 Tax=Aneurinibacillus aneurinilyticus TaxID=1391 RepID=UPI00367233EE
MKERAIYYGKANTYHEELPANRIEIYTDTLVRSFAALITAYEQQQTSKILEILQFNVLPAYKNWRMELRKQLQPYIIS